MRVLLTLLISFTPVNALACGLALILAVDVSGSVGRDEYRIQMDGLAAALRDGIVSDALVNQNAAVALIQWSGSSRQAVTIPWTHISSFEEVDMLAERIAADPRRWRNYSTAIGEALTLSIKAFDAVLACSRRVIDVSGDGISNEGIDPQAVHPALHAAGIVVNGLAIETDELDLTAYFYENLIIGEGAFVITAHDFVDYPEQIRRKLQRETTERLSILVPGR